MKSLTLRSLVFWSHLVVGIAVGIVVLLMSATGVLLTYERQIAEWVEQGYAVAIRNDQQVLPVDSLITTFQILHPDEDHFQLRIVNRPGAAIPIWAGAASYLVNPYTAEVLREGNGTINGFFDFVTGLHRWLAIEGEGFSVARAVTNYSNLLFLFLIVSGLYLWLPRVWRWPILKNKVFFNPLATNRKARDYNWHHVLGFWSLLPLLFIVLSATVFYFPWATSLLYAAYSEQIEDRSVVAHEKQDISIAGPLSYELLLRKATSHAVQNDAQDWHSIWVQTGTGPREVEFYIDRSIGHRPNLAYELTLDIDSGELLKTKHHKDWSRGDQAWDVARFGHTGEWWGFAGQTIAGFSSLAACLLVYTGLSLAWRRLITPLIRQSEI